MGETEDTGTESNTEQTQSNNQAKFKSNTSVGSSGGLGSYTPSKIQLSDSPFLLGVSRAGPASTTAAATEAEEVAEPAATCSPTLLPADHGLSWGHAASSD